MCHTEQVTFILPIEIFLCRKTKEDKRVSLNLNWYRNAHYQVTSQAKREFNPLSMPSGLKAKKIRISYHVEKKTKRRYDTMNIVSVVDKFFLDWLVSTGSIEDDNCNIVSYGKIDGVNGCSENRVIAVIEILE